MSSLESKERNDITVGMCSNSGKSSSTTFIFCFGFFSGSVEVISGSTATSRTAFGFLVKPFSFIATLALFRPPKVWRSERERGQDFAFVDLRDHLWIFITYG
jgi:hypothetical protein